MLCNSANRCSMPRFGFKSYEEHMQREENQDIPVLTRLAQSRNITKTIEMKVDFGLPKKPLLSCANSNMVTPFTTRHRSVAQDVKLPLIRIGGYNSSMQIQENKSTGNTSSKKELDILSAASPKKKIENIITSSIKHLDDQGHIMLSPSESKEALSKK